MEPEILDRAAARPCGDRRAPFAFSGLVSWAIMLSALTGACVATDATAAEPSVDYMILVTGNELLSGVYADGHTFFLTRTLKPLGLHCVGSMSVDDRPEDIRRALRFRHRPRPPCARHRWVGSNGQRRHA